MAWSRNLKKDIIINLPSQMTHIKILKGKLHYIKLPEACDKLNQLTGIYFLILSFLLDTKRTIVKQGQK